jgi:RNA polymerase sigma-70 factor (ECF subfamily)
MAPPITPAVGTDGRTRTTQEAVALLHQAQAGDIEAFAALYSTYRGLIVRYVYVRTHDRDAADDLVHDTFTDALAGLHAADDDVVGWLLRLAARACTRHSWGIRRYRRAFHELHEEKTPGPAARSDTPHINLMAAIIAGAQLTPGQRHAVQLRLAGYPRDAAAIEMDRTREAVRGLERRAIRHMRALVAVVGVQ